MSLLDGFSTFNFDEGAPYVSVTKNGLTFNKGVIMKLGYPSHALLLINNDTKQLAIKVCDESTPNSAPFYKSNGKGILSVRWNSKDLLQTIKNLTGWDLEMESYRAAGTLLREENAMLFDLSRATPMN